MLIIEKMLIFLLLMLVGLLLARIRMLDEKGSRTLSAIVLYVANPALIINASQTEHIIPGGELLWTVAIAAVMFAVLIAVAAVLPKLMRLERDEANAYALMTVFSNIGYMGIPLISEILGEQALLYVAVFIILFNILIYTYGVMVLQRGTVQNVQPQHLLRKLINPGVVSGIIAVAFYLLRVQLPTVIAAPPWLSERTDRAIEYDGDRRGTGKCEYPLVFYRLQADAVCGDQAADPAAAVLLCTEVDHRRGRSAGRVHYHDERAGSQHDGDDGAAVRGRIYTAVQRHYADHRAVYRNDPGRVCGAAVKGGIAPHKKA